MDEEKYQKELFEFEKPKRFFPKLSDFFPKADFERNVVFTLTLDKVVFIAIGIIMVMVAVYALGVETGKFRAIQITQAPTVAVPVTIQTTPAQAVKVAPIQGVSKVQPGRPVISAAQNVKVQTRAVPVVKMQPAVTIPATAAASIAAKPYVIVAAAFSRKDTAAQEVNKLKRQGFDAILVQSDPYFLACVGAYADKVSAVSQGDLKKVKRLYKDAYFKLR